MVFCSREESLKIPTKRVRLLNVFEQNRSDKIMAKGLKIYSKYDKYEYYKIESIGDKYYIKRFDRLGIISDDWSDIGSARSFEDAIAIAKSDASQFGSIYKVDFD